MFIDANSTFLKDLTQHCLLNSESRICPRIIIIYYGIKHAEVVLRKGHYFTSKMSSKHCNKQNKQAFKIYYVLLT